MKRPVTRIEIERFLRITGMPVTKFGRGAVNDPRLIGDLRAGSELGPGREERVAAFMSDHAKAQQTLAERLREFRP